MPLTRRQFLIGAAVTAGATTASVAAAEWMKGLDEQPPMVRDSASPTPGPLARESTPTPPPNTVPPSAVAFALTRMTFGPRPGDAERVARMGLDQYIDQQLHPESIDDSAMDQMLEAFPSLKMSVAELYQNYPQPRPQPKPQPAATPVPGATPSPSATPAPAAMRPKGPQEVIYELQTATVLRAIYSERQLFELMVDFWSNHFNIYIGKNGDRWLKTVDDREVIRRHALGKFKDLLTASAQSPAMLEYLDNRVSVKGKPNENYAREIMELHTLSVDGGYTYPDIQNVARAFTGWTIVPPRGMSGQAGEYAFNARQHDTDAKTVLGVQIPAGGGESDGLKVIDILANHPSTAKFIAFKLVRRFVSDVPPQSLVDRVSGVYRQTGGDIREMMRTILTSDEFKGAYGQKVRRPFEYLVSVLRALDVRLDVKDADILRGVVTQLGQPLFQWPTPDGYPDVYGAWINTNGLLSRWNVALNLAQAGARGIQADVRTPTMSSGAQSAADLADFWVRRLLNRPLAPSERDKLVAYLNNGNVPFALDDRFLKAKLPGLVALILSSPDYQYR